MPPRYYFTRKERVEDCIKLSTFILNKLGILNRSHSGSLSSRLDDLGKKVSIAYTINVDRFDRWLNELTQYITFSYSIIDNFNQRKDISQQFNLTKTRCNFGGIRYWFICSCLKKVGVLYKLDSEDTFACRHCYNLTYNSRNLGGVKKKLGISFLGLEEMEMSITKRFYKGVPTKRYSRFLRKCQKVEDYENAWREKRMKKTKSEGNIGLASSLYREYF